MNAFIPALIPSSTEITSVTGYIIGAATALVLFGYLLYSLVKPEKF